MVVGGRQAVASLRARARTVVAHPVLVTAVAVGVLAVAHGLWLSSHRGRGGLNIDEQTYVGVAIRMHHSLRLHEFWGLVYNGYTGPAVPFLAALLMFVGRADQATAMWVQPLLMWGAAVGVAGIVRRTSGDGAAIVAGVGFSVLPAVVAGSHTFFLSMGGATVSALALWALLASERGTRRPIWLFGLMLGLLPLTRTMSMSFWPGLALAGVWHCWGGGRGRWRAIAAVVGSGLVFGPNLWFNGKDIFVYLLDAGYGDRSASEFPGSPWLRPFNRVRELSEQVGGPTLWVMGALVLVLLWHRFRRGDDRPGLRAMGSHPLAAVAVFAAGGYAALLSTPNNGTFFELPLLVAVVALGAGIAARVPSRLQPVPVVALAAVGLLALANSFWLVDPEAGLTRTVLGRYRWSIVEGLSQNNDYLAGEDPRFDPRRRSEQPAAAAQWVDAMAEVDDWLARRADDDPEFDSKVFPGATLYGENASSLDRIARQVDYWGGERFEIRDLDCSTPDHGRTRVFVANLATPGEFPWAHEEVAWAEDHCWVEVHSIPSPTGRRIVFLEHRPRSGRR